MIWRNNTFLNQEVLTKYENILSIRVIEQLSQPMALHIEFTDGSTTQHLLFWILNKEASNWRYVSRKGYRPRELKSCNIVWKWKWVLETPKTVFFPFEVPKYWVPFEKFKKQHTERGIVCANNPRGRLSNLWNFRARMSFVSSWTRSFWKRKLFQVW